MKTYSALIIAKYIVTKCANDGCPITCYQLQKILYSIHKEYIQSDNRLFHDCFEAWQISPIIPNVYYDFCHFGCMPIPVSYGVSIDVDTAKRIDPIIENKRLLEPWDFMAEIMAPGSAWDITYNKGSGKGSVINNELIKTNG